MTSTETTNTGNKPTLAIRVDQIQYWYKKKKHMPDLSIPLWNLERGKQIFLFGDSGSGKTTLLNLLAGVLTPNEGTIHIFDQAFSSLSARQRDKFRARHIGVVFQQFNLIPYLSVLKNIQLAGHFASVQREHIDNQIKDLLSKLKLPSTILYKRANELSVGQQQRVAIARALINKPELLLVDEPTSALDASARDAFMKVLIDTCNAANTTMVFVSHDMSLQAYFDTSVEMPSLCQTVNHVEEFK